MGYQLREVRHMKTMNGMEFKMVLTAMLIGGFFIEIILTAMGIK